jgi:methionyl-tRNA formyltransferase
MNKQMKVIFMGTSAFAVPILERLAARGAVLLVVTPPDKPAGRKKELHPCPVKVAALALGLPVVQPEKLKQNEDFEKTIRALDPDVIVVAAYGKFLPASLLKLPRHGCVNVHPSLLPKYRGATPLQSALRHGDTETGISIVVMTEGMDSGPIIDQVLVAIEPADTFLTLQQRLADVSAALLDETLPKYLDGTITPREQQESLMSLADPMVAESREIDWNESAASIINYIRAWGETAGSFTTCAGERINVVQAAVCDQQHAHDATAPGTIEHAVKTAVCVRAGEGWVTLQDVQPAGKKRMPATAWINGHANCVGKFLGT